MSTVTPRDLDPKPTTAQENLRVELYNPSDDTNYYMIATQDVKEITGATGTTETLISPSDGLYEQIIGRFGSGTGTATFNAPSGVNIRWPDGATTSDIVFEGTGNATIISRAGELYVKEYEDSGYRFTSDTDWSSWIKHKNGRLEQEGSDPTSISASSGNQAVPITITMPHAMINKAYEYSVMTRPLITADIFGITYHNTTANQSLTAFTVLFRNGSAATHNIDEHIWSARGRWR